jgi:hypothetical protein
MRNIEHASPTRPGSGGITENLGVLHRLTSREKYKLQEALERYYWCIRIPLAGDILKRPGGQAEWNQD